MVTKKKRTNTFLLSVLTLRSDKGNESKLSASVFSFILLSLLPRFYEPIQRTIKNNGGDFKWLWVPSLCPIVCCHTNPSLSTFSPFWEWMESGGKEPGRSFLWGRVVLIGVSPQVFLMTVPYANKVVTAALVLVTLLTWLAIISLSARPSISCASLVFNGFESMAPSTFFLFYFPLNQPSNLWLVTLVSHWSLSRQWMLDLFCPVPFLSRFCFVCRSYFCSRWEGQRAPPQKKPFSFPNKETRGTLNSIAAVSLLLECLRNNRPREWGRRKEEEEEPFSMQFPTERRGPTKGTS